MFFNVIEEDNYIFCIFLAIFVKEAEMEIQETQNSAKTLGVWKSFPALSRGGFGARL